MHIRYKTTQKANPINKDAVPNYYAIAVSNRDITLC